MLRSFVAIGGVSLLLCCTPVQGRGERMPSEHCPPLPERGPADVVSLYVEQALDVPGVVCARVINGFSSSIVGAGGYLRLEQWEDGKFRDVDEILFGGAPMIIAADRPSMPAGAVIENRLPAYGQPAPPGRYRVCFRYISSGHTEIQQVCSTALTLP